MSESEPTTSDEPTTSSRKRSSSSSKRSSEPTAVATYDDALEAGYIGGPADDTDYTVAASAAEEASE
jgi:hypothetical protein